MAYFIPDYTKKELELRANELERIAKEKFPEIIMNTEEKPHSLDLEFQDKSFIGVVYPAENRIFIDRKDPNGTKKSISLSIASGYEKAGKGFWAVKYEEEMIPDKEDY